MRVLFIGNQSEGVIYWRLRNFEKYLKRLGVQVHTIYNPRFEGDAHIPKTFLELERKASQSDVIVLQRTVSETGAALVYSLRESHKIPILIEIDDDALHVNPDMPTYPSNYPGSPNYIGFLREISMADGLICSTQPLKKLLKRFNKHAYVVPNAIDFELVKKYRSSDKVCIGWVGGSGHSNNLFEMKYAIERLLKKYKDKIEFKMVGAEHSPLDKDSKVTVVNQMLPVRQFFKQSPMDKIDIGIAPLLDNQFNRCKSNLRFLLYSAMQIPTVASNVGPYQCIKHGVTGFKVDYDDEWFSILEKLIQDKELRHRIAQNAFEYVFESFNVKRIAEDYVKILREVVSNGHKSIRDSNRIAGITQ